MPLIREGAEQTDTWTFAETDTLDGPTCVPFTFFIAHRDALLSQNGDLGVALSPEDDPHALKDDLERLSLIAIDFPKYTDGRGFSQAQLLRRRLGYAGEIRAIGHVLRDQILYMHRSGVSAYQTSRADLPSVLDALSEMSAFYQPGADGATSVFARRHRAGS